MKEKMKRKIKRGEKLFFFFEKCFKALEPVR